MSKKQRQHYHGCTLARDHGLIRLRFRVEIGERRVRVSRATGLAWTAANRRKLARIVEMVGGLVRAGRSLEEIDAALGRETVTAPPADLVTVERYYHQWLRERAATTPRKSGRRKYVQHFKLILPTLGPIELGNLIPADIRGLQSELLAANRSPKYVRNVMGSLRVMLGTAEQDGLVSAKRLYGGLSWPEHEPPEPSPLTADERERVLAWFASALYGFHAGKKSVGPRFDPHPPFYAYVFTLFWTGLRPSEASGLLVRDLDLERGLLFVRRSRSEYQDARPKTRQARRTVELFPAVVTVLRSIIPTDASPDRRVFTNTLGRPIEPTKFNRDHWTRALADDAVKVSHRGLYSTKDTFVTMAMMLACPPAWIEEQTGVAWATLKRHYAKWLHGEGVSPLRRFEAAQPSLFSSENPVVLARQIGPEPQNTKPSQVEAGGIERPSHQRNPGSETPPERHRLGPIAAIWTGGPIARRGRHVA